MTTEDLLIGFIIICFALTGALIIMASEIGDLKRDMKSMETSHKGVRETTMKTLKILKKLKSENK